MRLGTKRNVVPDCAPDQLERAVHVNFPAPAPEATEDAIGAPGPIARGDIGATIDGLHEMVELTDVELAVRSGHEDEVEAGAVAAGGDGFTLHQTQRQARGT